MADRCGMVLEHSIVRAKKGGNMNSALRRTTENIKKVYQPHFEKQPLSGYLYLLERSLDRYAYLKERGAPDIIVDAEKDLICRRLLSFGVVPNNVVSGR